MAPVYDPWKAQSNKHALSTSCQGAARTGCSPRQGKMGAEHDNMAGRGYGFTGKGAVPQYLNRKGRARPVTVTRAQPADQITREDHSDEESPRSSQEFESVGKSQGPDLGGAWPEDRLGCNTVEA